MRYFIALAYDGSAYHGWQRQPNALGVQQVIEEQLAQLLKVKHIPIIGAGRTDAGVHARCQYFHFDYEGTLPNSFTFRLNCILPPTIAVYGLYTCTSALMNARFDAISREYHYHILRKKSPFAYGRSLLIYYALDLDMMQKAAECLLNYQDFASFAKENNQHFTTICNLYFAEWILTPDEWIFKIKANRFLRGMVRAIVGSLLEVGRGKLSIVQFKEIIEAKDRRKAPQNVVPFGLFLHNVEYPEGSLQLIDTPNKNTKSFL